MMLSKNEKKILKLIKYAPVLIVGFFSIFITYLIFLDKNVQYNRDINDLKNRFLDENINRITIEVNRTYKYIQHEKANSEERLKSLIKDKVKEAHKNMTFIYEKYKDIESKEKIINRIKDSLRNYRFNQNRGYFYIYEKTGKNIMLPSQPYMESEDFWNHQDLKGSFIIFKRLFSFFFKYAAFNAFTSAWDCPASLCASIESISPSFTTTQPTAGFGYVRS
jgi:hypothetical protein